MGLFLLFLCFLPFCSECSFQKESVYMLCYLSSVFLFYHNSSVPFISSIAEFSTKYMRKYDVKEVLVLVCESVHIVDQILVMLIHFLLFFHENFSIMFDFGESFFFVV